MNDWLCKRSQVKISKLPRASSKKSINPLLYDQDQNGASSIYLYVSISFTSSKYSSPQMWKPHELDQIPVTLLSCRVSQVILTESTVPDWHTDSSPREFCYSKQEEAHVAMAIIHYVKRLKARLQEEQRKARSLSSGKWRLHIAFFHTSNPTSSCFFS